MSTKLNFIALGSLVVVAGLVSIFNGAWETNLIIAVAVFVSGFLSTAFIRLLPSSTRHALHDEVNAPTWLIKTSLRLFVKGLVFAWFTLWVFQSFGMASGGYWSIVLIISLGSLIGRILGREVVIQNREHYRPR
jgi:hypothetical protein